MAPVCIEGQSVNLKYHGCHRHLLVAYVLAVCELMDCATTVFPVVFIFEPQISWLARQHDQLQAPAQLVASHRTGNTAPPNMEIGGVRSDYTEGVPGIGIVNALEIVRAFPTDEGLQSFRDWVNNPDAQALAAAQGKAVEAGTSGDPVIRLFISRLMSTCAWLCLSVHQLCVCALCA